MREERVTLGRVEPERVSGIGDSDDPLAESEKPEHERSPDEASAAENNARPAPRVQLRQAIVVELVADHHFLIIFSLFVFRENERKRERERERERLFRLLRVLEVWRGIMVIFWGL